MSNIINLYGDDYYKNKGEQKFNKAFQLVLEKKYDESLSHFQEALAFEPSNPKYAFYCGLSSYYLNLPSVQYFQTAAACDIENVEYQTWYGISLYYEKEFEKARKVFLYAYSLDVNDEKSYLYYIRTLNQLKQYQQAILFIENIEEVSSEILFELAYAQMNEVDLTNAEINFIRSIELNEDNTVSVYFLSKLYCKIGEFEKAKNVLKELSDRKPEERKMVEKQIKTIDTITGF